MTPRGREPFHPSDSRWGLSHEQDEISKVSQLTCRSMSELRQAQPTWELPSQHVDLWAILYGYEQNDRIISLGNWVSECFVI